MKNCVKKNCSNYNANLYAHCDHWAGTGTDICKYFRSEKVEDFLWEEMTDPLNIQVGSNHYKTFEIQPIEYTMANKLNFLQGCVIKRITRYDQPTGKGIEDLEKIKHEVDLLINFIRGKE